MNTDAVRARNARKRAKLKAHRRGLIEIAQPRPHIYMWEFAVRGNKNPFPDYVQDAELDSPYLPDWATRFDYLDYAVRAEEGSSLTELKARVREQVECVYGFNEYDLDVKLVNRYKI